MLEENQRRWQAATEKYQREVSRLSLIIEKTQSVIGLCKRYGLTDGEIPYPIVHALEKEFPDCKLQQDGSFLFKGAAAGAVAAVSALGGTAVLGTASTGTAIAAGGYLWDKSVRQQHLKVVAYEKAVDEECRILQQIYRRYDALHMKLINWLAREQYNRRIKGGAE